MSATNVTRKDIVAGIASSTSLNAKQAGEALDAFVNFTGDALASGKRVPLRHFGTLQTKVRAARAGRNPQTGAELKIAAHNAVTFKPAAALKTKVNA